jgi:PKD repeat protein
MNRFLLLFLLTILTFSASAQSLQARFSVDSNYHCFNNTPYQFHDLSVGDDTLAITSWRWNFGDGSYSSLQSPSHVYGGSGAWTVSLTVKNVFGDSSVYTQKDAVIALPVGLFYRKFYLCNGSSIDIKTIGSENPGVTALQTYNWSNGATTPNITVNTAGIYKLTYRSCGLTITDSAFVISDTGYARILPPSPGNWVQDNFSIIASASLLYHDEDYGLTHWTWGDGGTSVKNTVRDPASHTYRAPGTYLITCGVTLNPEVQKAPCADTISSYQLTVRDPYIKHNSWNRHDTSLVSGTTLWLNAGGSAATYNWYSGPNTIVSTDSIIGITVPGKYWVNIYKNGDQVTDSINVKAVDSAALHAVIKIASQECDVVTFIDSSTSYNYPIVKREWNFGFGINSQTGSTVSFTFPGNAKYPITLIVHNSAGRTDTARIYVPLNPYPSVALLKGDTITIPQGDTVSLRNGLPDVGYKYHWSTGDTSKVIVVNTAGKYLLTVEHCGFYASDSVYVKVSGTIGDTAHLAFSYSMPSACDPGLVVFKNLTIPSSNDPIVSYNWNFGNGTTSHEKDPYLYYTESSFYVITLTATSASGVTSVISKVISVRLDKWQIHTQVNNITTGRSCRDTAAISASVVGTEGHQYTITWDKPLVNDSLVFSPGFYTAYLKDSCGNVRDTVSLNVVMNQPLAAAIQPVHDTLFGSHSVFNSSLNVTYNWNWYRNDSLLAGNNLPYYVIRNQPKGTYKLVVTNSLGCIATSGTYTNSGKLTVNYTYSASSCDARNVTFSGIINSTDSIVAYNWSIGYNSHWTTKNATISFPTPGPYDVTFSVRNIYGDTASITKHLVIPQVAAWTAKINRTGGACADTVVLTVETNLAAAAFHWSNGATTRSITVRGGTYVVDVLDSCNTVRARDTAEVLYNVPFTATITLGRGYQDTLYAYPALNTSTYTWYKNGQVINQHTSIIFPQGEGTYTVTILNERGCSRTSDPFVYTSVTDTVTLNTGTVNGNDSLPITASFNHDFNTGNVFTAQLMLDNSGGRNPGLDANEVINLGSISGTSRDVAMNVTIPGNLACASNYIIRITASSPADTTSWSKQFSIINQPPQPVISQRGDSLSTSGIYNWQWYKNNVAIDGATAANYRARANGNYRVEANNGSGCVSSSSTIAVVITAVGEVTLGDNKAKVFPNPSEGLVHLQFSKPLLKKVTVSVHNLQGRVMYTRTTQQQSETLDLTSLPKGIYLVEISGYGTQKVLTIVLQ